jgi:hypothetical protein
MPATKQAIKQAASPRIFPIVKDFSLDIKGFPAEFYPLNLTPF